MAKITIDIPDKDITGVIEAFEWKYEYSRNKRGTETKAQFAKRIEAQRIKGILHEHKRHLVEATMYSQINDEMKDIDIK